MRFGHVCFGLQSSPSVDPMPEGRTRAATFDAARLGSWHYYKPVASTRTERPPLDTRTQSGAPCITVAARSKRTTWTRMTRSMSETSPTRRLTRTVIEAGPATPSQDDELRRAAIAELVPRTPQEWNDYLTLAGSSVQERNEIMADVFRALRLNHGQMAQPVSSQVRESTSESLSRTTSLRAPPQRQNSHTIASALHDPDFGDTSAYWNTINANLRNVTGFARIARRIAPSINTLATIPPVPRQPTHLNYERLAPQFTTVRRRSSAASIASNGTLPEYSASVVDGHLALPRYRAQVVQDIRV